MKRLHQSENGLSLIELLLLLLLILLLLFVSWYVWSQKNKNQPNSANNSAPSSSTQTTKKTEPTNQATTATYLKIPEWGIKVKLSDNILDAYYDTAKEADSFNLRVKSMDTEADCKTGDLSVAGIFKASKDEPDPQQAGKTIAQTQKGVVIGDTFYYIGVAQYYCTQDAGKQALLNKVRTAFTNVTTQIEKL